MVPLLVLLVETSITYVALFFKHPAFSVSQMADATITPGGALQRADTWRSRQTDQAQARTRIENVKNHLQVSAKVVCSKLAQKNVPLR